MVAAFTNGLRKGKFLFSLYKNDLKTMLEVLYRATKYMNTKDALLAREEKPRKKRKTGRYTTGSRAEETEDGRQMG